MPQHEPQQVGQLGAELFRGAEDVGVVLGDAPDPEQPVEHAGPLEAVDRPELEQPDRQLPVGALAGLVDQDVHRAVHGLRVVGRALHLHRRVHPLGVPVEVAGHLEQGRLGQVGGPHELVAGLLVLGPGVVLHQLADQAALGVEDRQPPADLRGEMEQVELGAEPAVVARLGLLEAAQVLVEGGLGLPRRPVDALQLGPALVAPPVGGRHLHELERSEPARWTARAGRGTGRRTGPVLR